ncbi:DUF5305 domain-containing protein [Vallitalea okinawensis]|uniref:DUF5305 domain-containing protein n=1 Tax=Vallitalea okinawensis TaxID=2078660 RepID=UPI000CFC754A|nr:DUF5305 domain-containing protein [Vallitalea okinawensis]
MKLRMNKNIKLGLLIIIGALMCLAFLMLYNELNPDFMEETTSLYNYSSSTDINYQAVLKPNIIYDNGSLDKGNIYITEFIDFFQTSFIYEFASDKESNISGDYEIIASVEGYTGEGETYKSIWKKKYELLPKTSLQAKDNRINIKEDIQLNINEYNIFVAQVIEESNINSNIKLTVSMNINLKANTEYGLVEERISPSIIVPLNTSFFEINESGVEEKPGSIEETKQIILPVNKSRVIVYSCILALSLMGLIFLIFFTKGINNIDQFEKELKKIFKNHGNRLVALNAEIAATCENLNKVKSIDDLVRIADEIGKPILYQYSPYRKDMNEFYVIDDNELYLFDINKKLEEQSSYDYYSGEETEEM